MKAILLAAGEGKRMRPLTLEMPKPMIEIFGKPLLYWIIKRLPDVITELIIVIGYKGDQIERYFGEQFEGKKITYVRQEKPTGTAHALALTKHLLAPSERFLFLYADDLHSADALARLTKHPIGVLVTEHEDPSRFGVVETDDRGRVISMEEKPQKPRSNCVAVGAFMLDTRVFDYPAPRHKSGEYFLHDQVAQMIAEHHIVAEETDFWHPIGYPHDIESAERLIKEQKGGSHERHATPVVIIAGGKGTRMPENEKDKPKCLVTIAGKPMLQWQLEDLRRQGFSDIILSLGHKANMVIAWLNESGYTDIKYAVETEPLGTGGGIKLALGGRREPFMAINCDDLANINLSELIRHSCKNKYDVISAMEVEDARTFGLLECDEYWRICKFKEKDQSANRGLVNIGHYYLQPDVFDGFNEAFSIEKDIFPKLAAAGRLVVHRHTQGYWVTSNNAEQLKMTREHFENMKNNLPRA